MLRWATFTAMLGAVIFSVSCSKSEGGDTVGLVAPSPSGSNARPGSGGGFSADLAKELGLGIATKAGDPPRPAGDTSAGTTAGKAGDAAGKAGDTAGGKAGDAAGKAGDTAGGKAGDASAGKAGDASAGKAGDASAGKAGAAAAGKTEAAGAAMEPDGKTALPASAAGNVPAQHGAVKVPADLAEIKLSLLPNWDRDVDEAGTFQYVVRIKGTQSTKTFTFHYGYDAPKAPTDREQYKKYLQDSRLLMGEIKDRQRGSAWFLEGTDRSGLPGFRYMVLYGGKRLICYGSLYKDADSSRLGDDRDQTVIQAKQICETLAL